MWKVKFKPIVFVKDKEGELICGQTELEFEFYDLEKAVAFSEEVINHSKNINSFEIGKE